MCSLEAKEKALATERREKDGKLPRWWYDHDESVLPNRAMLREAERLYREGFRTDAEEMRQMAMGNPLYR